MNMNKNHRYDCLVEAGQINDLIRRLHQTHDFYNKDDKMEVLMAQWCFKKLERIRDDLTHQGLLGLKNDDKIDWGPSSDSDNS